MSVCLHTYTYHLFRFWIPTLREYGMDTSFGDIIGYGYMFWGESMLSIVGYQLLAMGFSCVYIACRNMSGTA